MIEKEVTLLAQLLEWSNTDNSFMNLGCHKGKKITYMLRISFRLEPEHEVSNVK